MGSKDAENGIFNYLKYRKNHWKKIVIVFNFGKASNF